MAPFIRVQRVHATDDTTDETSAPELDVSIDLELASDLDLGDGNNYSWISRVFYSDVALADDDTGWQHILTVDPEQLTFSPKVPRSSNSQYGEDKYNSIRKIELTAPVGEFYRLAAERLPTATKAAFTVHRVLGWKIFALECVTGKNAQRLVVEGQPP